MIGEGASVRAMLGKLSLGLIGFVGLVVVFRWAHDTYGPGIALSAMAVLIALGAVVLVRFPTEHRSGGLPFLDDD